MTKEEERLAKDFFTPEILFEYLNVYTNNKHITCSEFKGFVKIQETEYVLTLNFMDDCERMPGFIELESIKNFIVKKRFDK